MTKPQFRKLSAIVNRGRVDSHDEKKASSVLENFHHMENRRNESSMPTIINIDDDSDDEEVGTYNSRKSVAGSKKMLGSTGIPDSCQTAMLKKRKTPMQVRSFDPMAFAPPRKRRRKPNEKVDITPDSKADGGSSSTAIESRTKMTPTKYDPHQSYEEVNRVSPASHLSGTSVTGSVSERGCSPKPRLQELAQSRRAKATVYGDDKQSHFHQTSEQQDVRNIALAALAAKGIIIGDLPASARLQQLQQQRQNTAYLVESARLRSMSGQLPSFIHQNYHNELIQTSNETRLNPISWRVPPLMTADFNRNSSSQSTMQQQQQLFLRQRLLQTQKLQALFLDQKAHLQL